MVSHSPQMKKMFSQGIWWLTMLMITIMLAFAIFNAIKRIGLVANKKLKQLMGISMIIGYICSATFFLLVVLKVMPWFNPQYCIPISGMIIGNAMTGIVLGANTLCSEMQAKRTEIENSIMLAILGCTALTVIIFVTLGYQTFFTPS